MGTAELLHTSVRVLNGGSERPTRTFSELRVKSKGWRQEASNHPSSEIRRGQRQLAALTQRRIGEKRTSYRSLGETSGLELDDTDGFRFRKNLEGGGSRAKNNSCVR